MAHTKSQGSTTNGRDSCGKRLGVKKFGGQIITAGSILVKQRGYKYFPGRNVGVGSDDTLFSKIGGTVKFEWTAKGKKKISVYPSSVN